MPPPAGRPLVIGRYVVFEKIAAGGMASVHLGRVTGAAGFARMVAVKRLHPHLVEDPEFVSMLVDEARLAARVQHPNVVPTLDVLSADGELLVVMEFVQGESLSRLMSASNKRRARVPVGIASAVVAGMLHGLHAAHEAKGKRGEPLGIVHRDVSPANVLVGVDGVPRIIDFGVAKALGRLQSTREGSLKGKPAYMAPEQLEGKAIDRRVDIYAAGVVLWEVITSRRLFDAENDVALLAKVHAGNIARPSAVAPDVPPVIDDIVMRAVSRDPSSRFATAREMASALEQAVTPALASAVGAWVEDIAQAAIASRRERVAALESGPDSPESLPAPPLPSPAPAARDELSTVALQVSNVPATARAGDRAPAQGGMQRRTIAKVAASALVIALAAFLGLRRSPTPDEVPAQRTTGAPIASAETVPLPPISAPPVAPSVTASPAPAVDGGGSPDRPRAVGTGAVPVTEVRRSPPSPKPPSTRERPAAPPRPSSPIRFSDPG